MAGAFVVTRPYVAAAEELVPLISHRQEDERQLFLLFLDERQGELHSACASPSRDMQAT
jgi:hypothetical protein